MSERHSLATEALAGGPETENAPMENHLIALDLETSEVGTRARPACHDSSTTNPRCTCIPRKPRREAPMKALVFAVMFAAGLAAALTGVARAASIAYDGIEYSPGALAPNGPAFGFSGPWAADPGVAVLPAGLASFLALPSAGGGVGGSFDFLAPLSGSLAPSPGKEFWAAFLLYHGTTNDQTFMGLSPAGAVLGDPPSVGFGVRLEQYGIFVGAAFTPAPTAYTPSGSTDFLVAHFTAGGATWNVELYVNKALFAVPDLVLNVAPVTYETMVNHNQTGFESDEFRLGDTSADIAAAPTGTKRITWGRVRQLYR